MTSLPIYAEIETFKPLAAKTPCSCSVKATESSAIVYFDKNYVGNVSAENILETIEFLRTFLPPATKKPKKKIRVRNQRTKNLLAVLNFLRVEYKAF